MPKAPINKDRNLSSDERYVGPPPSTRQRQINTIPQAKST